jgi:hypothetical protein
MSYRTSAACLVSFSAALLLAACGGGDADVPTSAQPSEEALLTEGNVAVVTGGGAARTQGSAGALAVSDSARIAAATATANSGTNVCATIRPFYWEVGSASARMASGSVKAAGVSTGYGANTPMAVASASKWLYAAYVAQRRAGVLDATDIEHLTMRSGYVSMYANCLATQSVDACLAYQGNGAYTAAADGRFYYNSGHMQKHASLMGLGALAPKALATELRSQLGTDVSLAYNQPQLAGGAYTTPDSYSRFLRKLLGGQLRMSALLGTQSTCTNPGTCPVGEALVSPTSQSWHYSLGHWVEDDPATGDGAFSSPGALGFYPWVDASRSWYGVVGRVQTQGWDGSTQCGRLIRRAWVSGGAL